MHVSTSPYNNTSYPFLLVLSQEIIWMVLVVYGSIMTFSDSPRFDAEDSLHSLKLLQSHQKMVDFFSDNPAGFGRVFS